MQPLTYAGLFLTALATLMLEVLLPRIISVITWYHFPFFVISLAMLGMTAGAVLVFVRTALFEAEAIPRHLAQASRPLGMERQRRFWVCASGLGLMSSMTWGITTTLWLGAGCYLLLPIATWRLTYEAEAT